MSWWQERVIQVTPTRGGQDWARLVGFVSMLAAVSAMAQEDLELARLRQQVYREAVAKVAPSMVQIQTTGGLEISEQVRRGTGPTTGLIVRADGWILASSFQLENKPAGVVVRLADDRLLAAKVIGVDYLRMVALLKVQADNLPTAVWSPRSDWQLGATVLALGKSLSVKHPSVSVGILSAVDRVWGRAVQTDAKVSPLNYGGPLVDLAGRVIGLLVPLAPDGKSTAAGVEWYDSGIGFAIPLADLEPLLEALQHGDIRPGLLGIQFKDENLFSEELIIQQVAWRSPAAQAGVREGDRLVTAAGKPLRWLADLRRVLGTRAAGDQVQIGYQHQNDTKSTTIQLMAELPIYRPPFLGVVVVSHPGGSGVTVIDVANNSPAFQAGLRPGDKLLEMNQSTIENATQFRLQLREQTVGEKVSLHWQPAASETQKQQAEVELTAWPQNLLQGQFTPAELLAQLATKPIAPAAEPKSEPDSKDESADKKEPTEKEAKPDVLPGLEKFLPENWFKRIPKQEKTLPYEVVEPKSALPARTGGLVIYLLDAESKPEISQVKQAWQAVQNEFGLYLVVLKPLLPPRWSMLDVNLTKEIIPQLQSKYSLNEQRVIIHATGNAGRLAELLATRLSDRITGVLIHAGGTFRAATPQPNLIQHFLYTWSEFDPKRNTWNLQLQKMQQQHVPAQVQTAPIPPTAYYEETLLPKIGNWTLLPLYL